MGEFSLTLRPVVISVNEEPSLGDRVVFVVLGKIGARVNDDFVVVPTTLMFDIGTLFEYPEGFEESEEFDDDES